MQMAIYRQQLNLYELLEGILELHAWKGAFSVAMRHVGLPVRSHAQSVCQGCPKGLVKGLEGILVDPLKNNKIKP